MRKPVVTSIITIIMLVLVVTAVSGCGKKEEKKSSLTMEFLSEYGF